jgi:hypothetical protein
MILCPPSAVSIVVVVVIQCSGEFSVFVVAKLYCVTFKLRCYVVVELLFLSVSLSVSLSVCLATCMSLAHLARSWPVLLTFPTTLIYFAPYGDRDRYNN